MIKFEYNCGELAMNDLRNLIYFLFLVSHMANKRGFPLSQNFASFSSLNSWAISLLVRVQYMGKA